MKASRTLNWYFCLSSIVRVCCEMVKNSKAGLFLLSFSNIRYSFILFISQKLYKISQKLAYDVDF